MRLPANEAGRYEMKQKTLAVSRKCFSLKNQPSNAPLCKGNTDYISISGIPAKPFCKSSSEGI